MSPPPVNHAREKRAWAWAADSSHRNALAQQARLDECRRDVAANPNDWAAQQNLEATEANHRFAVAEVVEYGQRERIHRVRARRVTAAVTIPTTRTGPRARSARPRAQASRSSSRSGDSGSDSDLPGELHLRLAPPARAVLRFGCLSAAERRPRAAR